VAARYVYRKFDALIRIFKDIWKKVHPAFYKKRVGKNQRGFNVAEIETVIQDNIHSFLKKLRQAGYQISSAYIFGSYVSGQMDEWSDIDVAIVSPQLSDDRFEERIRLTEIAISINDRIEPLPFSLDSFTDDNPLVRQIKTNGLLIEGCV